MTIDLPAATSFLAGHGRILDRRRLAHLLGHGDAEGVLAALDGHRNPDGGYGWALEPDLRSAESQPTAAMHAFEVLAEVGPATSPHAVELCDWLAAHSLDDGGLPFVLPIGDPAGCAPWWLGTQPPASSLQMTAQVAASAHRVAGHDPAVAGHRWLAGATAWCLAAIAAIDGTPPAYELLFALQLLDAVADTVPQAEGLLEQLGRHIPAGGAMPVAGGIEGQRLHPTDFAPEPGRPVRRLFTDDDVAADLDRLAGLQQPDGGWVVDFDSFSPAATLDWRGYATVRAVTVLQRNGA